MSFLLTLIESIWTVFARMAPWLLLGFLIAGIVAVWIPQSFVMRCMGGSTGFRGVLRAVLIGVPLPICSCGVIPISAALRQHGAGKGATAAFLISTPQTGIDSILATYALMGPIFAICRPIAAFLTGLVGGMVVDALSPEDAIPPTKETPKPHSKESRGLRAILYQGYVRLLGSVIRPLLMGLLIAACVTVWVPHDFFVTLFGGRDILVMPLMILLGFPMYICSTAAIPIAVSLLAKGISPGAAFVFLMVGPAVNALSIATVSPMIGRKAAIAYVAVIALGATLCGIGVNLLVAILPLPLLPHAQTHTVSLSLLQQASGIVLAGLMAYAGASPEKTGPCCTCKPRKSS